ncbi:MAG TPA: hypothetical protein VN837_21450 [Chloroflexota bacterium]|nr:hypothetical protein [Chloroflexota bacterium]
MSVTKTAISIPRELFERGEQVAADLGISRSELYARALRTLLRERKILAARARLDEAIAHGQAGGDSTLTSEELHGIAAATMRRAAERGESTW